MRYRGKLRLLHGDRKVPYHLATASLYNGISTTPMSPSQKPSKILKPLGRVGVFHSSAPTVLLFPIPGTFFPVFFLPNPCVPLKLISSDASSRKPSLSEFQNSLSGSRASPLAQQRSEGPRGELVL